ncbi:PadR family transcriptional regulator [Deinococcus sp. 6GRE01]|uniref:PadR family transcriptional regulator n=1 Tax=Deinococcus sp. 6GRE01 TaxID=2745873 RepID=UPI001E3EC822
MTSNILKVLGVLSGDSTGQLYPLELSKRAHVNVGSVYAVLDRLEQAKYVQSQLEDIDPKVEGRPQRRYYAITGEGRSYFQKHMDELRQIMPVVNYA